MSISQILDFHLKSLIIDFEEFDFRMAEEISRRMKVSNICCVENVGRRFRTFDVLHFFLFNIVRLFLVKFAHFAKHIVLNMQDDL